MGSSCCRDVAEPDELVSPAAPSVAERPADRRGSAPPAAGLPAGEEEGAGASAATGRAAALEKPRGEAAAGGGTGARVSSRDELSGLSESSRDEARRATADATAATTASRCFLASYARWRQLRRQ